MQREKEWREALTGLDEAENELNFIRESVDNVKYFDGIAEKDGKTYKGRTARPDLASNYSGTVSLVQSKLNVLKAKAVGATGTMIIPREKPSEEPKKEVVAAVKAILPDVIPIQMPSEGVVKDAKFKFAILGENLDLLDRTFKPVNSVIGSPVLITLAIEEELSAGASQAIVIGTIPVFDGDIVFVPEFTSKSKPIGVVAGMRPVVLSAVWPIPQPKYTIRKGAVVKDGEVGPGGEGLVIDKAAPVEIVKAFLGEDDKKKDEGGKKADIKIDGKLEGKIEGTIKSLPDPAKP
jgi:hypothetical protein